MRFQPKVRGGRDKVYSAIWHKLYNLVESEASQHGVSKSWVVACAVADWFNVDIVKYYDKYYDNRKSK